MKQYIKISLLLVLIIAATQTVKAQRNSWVPDNGYWVVQSTKTDPHHTIVHYYLENGTQIYTETINGVALKINRYKVKMTLKQHLQQAIIAWENGHPLQDTANIAWNTAGKKEQPHAAAPGQLTIQ